MSWQCRGTDRKTQPVRRRRAYAYLCKPLLTFDSEVARIKEQLSSFARESELELAAVFVEEVHTAAVSFEQLVQAVIQDKGEVVLVPSLHHLVVLGSPNHIKDYFESATGAQVIVATPSR